MSSITELPLELWLDNILPALPLPDVARLAQTCKFFGDLAADDTFWKRKCDADFNFSAAGTARTSGWKFIYSGLSKPRVYVWGNRQNGRLGLSEIPKTPLGDVSHPVQLPVQNARIVSLAAAGTSFHALDTNGGFYVWGTLNGNGLRALKSDGFSDPGKRADGPLKLNLPVSMRSVSCGRFHAASLDTEGDIWNFTSWGRPFRLISPQLLERADSAPVQVECGWDFVSALSRSGDVYVWFPSQGEVADAVRQTNLTMDSEEDEDKREVYKAHADDDSKVIKCATWDFIYDPLLLPPLPKLPQLRRQAEEASLEEIVIVQIAAYDGALIALTNQGHVVQFKSLANEATVSSGSWEYLPAFSELGRVRELPAFTQSETLQPPTALKITHISAHFKHFTAYSTGPESTVLIGGTETPSDQPQVIPGLQRRGVISVVLGDWHYGALTTDGKVLTWGAYSNGALGLGDPTQLAVGTAGGYADEHSKQQAQERGRGAPPAVEVPTEVRFDHRRKTPKDRFCISLAASGWHTGALVIDLEEKECDNESDIEEETRPANPPLQPRMPHRFNPLPLDPNQTPFAGGLRGGPAFRVGFAGRGMNRGAMPGRGRGGPGGGGEA
ncbi:RCC1/BLIP-II protein [Cylindrobasidium torrendii FP15055 ss-10]|uniref:RCC1/BLIP-II protein n=1 Tax=Cylindrobasidium torrendii FP15055 ss-10 TaxID=1314674 RepID=A0A0D7BNS9_9AGAR|nr:RCC1/BLIP-II protein [Cylindrobasidium torrendii FP15055 ss-10]